MLEASQNVSASQNTLRLDSYLSKDYRTVLGLTDPFTPQTLPQSFFFMLISLTSATFEEPKVSKIPNSSKFHASRCRWNTPIDQNIELPLLDTRKPIQRAEVLSQRQASSWAHL